MLARYPMNEQIGPNFVRATGSSFSVVSIIKTGRNCNRDQSFSTHDIVERDSVSSCLMRSGGLAEPLESCSFVYVKTVHPA